MLPIHTTFLLYISTIYLTREIDCILVVNITMIFTCICCHHINYTGYTTTTILNLSQNIPLIVYTISVTIYHILYTHIYVQLFVRIYRRQWLKVWRRLLTGWNRLSFISGRYNFVLKKLYIMIIKLYYSHKRIIKTLVVILTGIKTILVEWLEIVP